MKKSEFQDYLQNRLVYLDGATGSNLVKKGMPAGVCPEKWILEHREVMLELQKKYVAAGSDILYAPTFTANRVKLGEYQLADQMEEMITGLVAISKEAAACTERKVYVAGDISMTGETLRPAGNMELETLIEVYKEQIRMMNKAGVDLLVVETMMSLAECRAALIAAKECCDLPVMVTMTFEPDKRTLYGTDAKTAAIVLESLGASAIGVNCSGGPAGMKEIVEDMVSVTRIPVIAKPNAGLPYLDENGHTKYSMSFEEFAVEMKALVEAGATILGGCCGTDPAYIRRIKEEFGTLQKVFPNRRPDGIRYLTSERQTVSFGLNDPFLIVGERINPTGKKLLQAQLREGSMEKVLQFAEEQEACGARILDVNMGMSGIDEKEMMLRAIEEISMVTNLPLSLDSSHVDVLEAALRHYPGRALINSISMEEEKVKLLLPIAKKYGAMFILLPLSDKGLPENIEEKKDIIQTVYKKATELGMSREDIIVDGLVATVGANSRAGIETLETIRYCKERGFATICGLSNISFGMPERSYVNTAFLSLAIHEGLTMAIANPSQELLVCCAYATDLLMAKEGSDITYIQAANQAKENRERKESLALEAKARAGAEAVPLKQGEFAADTTPGTPGFTDETRSNLYHGVLKGNKNGIEKLTRLALETGNAPDALLNDVLMPAINEVGVLFDKGKYFLPQLIASAEAMKNAIAVLEPLLLKEGSSEEMPVVVIATVEGDIHDIGKNLVAMMLKNYGYRVIDLGKDVPASEIITAAKEHHASIIALSALMTTTMQRMREVVAEVKKEGLPVKIMIGGAVITQEYADEIGADGYSRDAAEAVKVAGRLLNS